MRAGLRLPTIASRCPSLPWCWPCALATAAPAVELDPKSVTFLKQEQFKWRDPSNKQPVNQPCCRARPTEPASTSTINAGKPDNFAAALSPERPLHHVIKGTWWMRHRHGPRSQPSRTDAARHPGDALRQVQVHWDGAKDDEDLHLHHRRSTGDQHPGQGARDHRRTQRPRPDDRVLIRPGPIQVARSLQQITDQPGRRSTAIRRKKAPTS